MNIEDLSFHKVFEKVLERLIYSYDLDDIERNYLIELKENKKNYKGLINSFEEQSLSFLCFDKRFNVEIEDLFETIESFDLFQEIEEIVKESSMFLDSFKKELSFLFKGLLKLRKGGLTKSDLIKIMKEKKRMDYLEGFLIKDIIFDVSSVELNQSYTFCVFENCTFQDSIYFDNIEHCIFKNCNIPDMASIETGTSVDVTFQNCSLTEVDFYDFYIDFITFENCKLKSVKLPDAFEEIAFINSDIKNPRFFESSSLYDLFIKNSSHDFILKLINKDMFYMMYKDSSKFSNLIKSNLYYVKIDKNHFLVEKENLSCDTWRYHKINKVDLNNIISMIAY